MKIASQTFRSACEYLGAFGNEASVMVFRPVGKEVIISLDGSAYAEYKCAVDAPLEHRFAVPMRIPSRLVATLSDDLLIAFALGSHLKMAVDGNEFTSPICDVEKLPDHPKLSEGVTFGWDAARFVPEIRAAMASTSAGNTGSPLESIRIEVLPARETIVASDGRRLSVYEAKANGDNGVRRDDEVGTQVLIHRSMVSLMLLACRSMSRVDIRSGVSRMQIECGRRKAILPIQDGAFPQWRDAMASIVESPKAWSVDVDRAEFIRAIRQVKADADQSSGAVALIGHSGELELVAQCQETGSYSRAYVRLGNRSAAKGTIKVGAKYLLSIATNWPDSQRIVIDYRGSTSPLVFSRKRFRAFLMPMLPSDADTKEKE